MRGSGTNTERGEGNGHTQSSAGLSGDDLQPQAANGTNLEIREKSREAHGTVFHDRPAGIEALR